MDCGAGLFGQSVRVHSYKQVHIGEKKGDAFAPLTWRQSKEFDRLERLYAGAVWPATPLEMRWRHSGWLPDRQRVFRALEATAVPKPRLERFACCGSGARVEIDRATGDARVRSSNCGDRFCIPCMCARCAAVRRRLDELAGGRSMQFWTFTIQNRDRDLVQTLNHLLTSFAKMRRADAFADNVTGGVGAIETKRGSGSGGWHTHIHCLVETAFADWSAVRASWKKATGDSDGFDAEEPKQLDRVGCYVTKYVSKGFDKTVLRRHDDLCECVVGLKGRRLLIPFGSWYGRTKDDQDRPEREWESVGSLEHVVREARAGSGVHRGHVTSLTDRYRRRLADLDDVSDVPAEI